MPAATDSTLQKTNVQTFQASFATETLGAHCGQRKGENGRKIEQQQSHFS
jgi:hypothetical protein